MRRLNIRTRSAMSCRQSLSVVQRKTSSPRFAAARATVAMTSSASNPARDRQGMFIAAVTVWMIGTWTSRSAGGGGRWAL